MDRGRAAAALLALAACVACSLAAPTASDHTALDLHGGPTEGCYYNFQHYGEGDRIMTNEPCLNCTCHNRMLMCYLRVCPFTKAIGQDCTVEKRADQCCPIVTCPDVPVDLLTSTSTSSPAEYGPTGMGKLDKYGCSINGKYFPEGSKVPPSPNKPCEHCYCIRNMTTCVMQECTLHVDGCTPIYHKDVCCPVRYSCDHTEDEIPLLDDMTTTVRPTPGFLLTTTTMMPVTQMTQDCVHDERVFPDGASIKTDKACEHCYCMKGDIVCVVQECGTPMENEGKNCTSLPPRQGQCCPDTYICEGDEPILDITTELNDLTSAPPRRVGVEGSGYRNEPDEPFTERGPFENEVEGSGDLSETDSPSKVTSDLRDELLFSTTEKVTQFSQSTEEDKGFNTIPDTVSEKEPLVTIEEHSYTESTESTNTEVKTTAAEELIPVHDVTSKNEDNIITTEASPYSQESVEILPTDIQKQEEASTIASELVTFKNEYLEDSATETIPVKKETEQVPDSTDKVPINDVPTTENTVLPVNEKDMSEDDMSSVVKINDSDMTTNIVTSITERNDLNEEVSTLKETNIVKDITTASNVQDLPETTSINPVDNEVDYIPARIPGEGDCLLNGITYSNNSAVPSTNNCHTGCRCASSIIKCDPIICSPPPEYMENMNDCQTSYDTPNACCPTYVCNAKETSLPQSHSQTSVTESSKPVATGECNGNECNFEEEKQPSHSDCESGNCESGSKQGDCGINGCHDQPPLVELPEDCSGEKCSVSPIISCEGENCETSATKEEVNKKTPSVLSNEPVCTDEHGCDNTRTEEECNEESCRRKETSESGTYVPTECSGTECKISDEQNVPVIEQTSVSTDTIFNEKSTETNISELVTQSITTSEKTIISASSTELASELPPTKDESSDTETSNTETIEERTTQVPIKLVTESITNKPIDVDNQKESDIPKEDSEQSETSPTEFMPISGEVTEKTKTSDEEPSTEKIMHNKPTGMEEIEAITESTLEDKTIANKDISSQEYTTEAVHITHTQQSESHSEMYETKQDESFTKLPTVMEDEEKRVTEILNEIEVKITTESEYHQSTTEKTEKVEIIPQPTKTQESVTTEIPESPVTENDIGDVNKIITEGVSTEFIQSDKTQKITSPGIDITEYPIPAKTEQQPIIIETVTSESSSSYDEDLTVKHDTYTESPQTTVTKSDITVDSESLLTTLLEDTDDKLKELSTPSSVIKESDHFVTSPDVTLPGNEYLETKHQEHASSTESDLLQPDDKNEGFNKEVTEKQITEIEEQANTQITQEGTEITKLDISTESNKETDMEPTVTKDSETVSPINVKEPTTDVLKDIPVTESSQTETGDQNLELKTTPEDISKFKVTSIAPVITDEGDNEITYTPDKNVIKLTSPSSDESATTENAQFSDTSVSEELTTQLPKETLAEGYPSKDVNIQTPIETYDEKQSPDLEIPEKSMETDGETAAKISTLTPPFTSDESSSKSPELVSESDLSSDISSDDVKVTSSSISYEKEHTTATISSLDQVISEKTENNLQEFTPTTLNTIQISESVTENINTQPQEYETEQSKDSEGSSEKPNEKTNEGEIDLDLTKKEDITESPYTQTTSVNLGGQEMDKNTKKTDSDMNDTEKSITVIPSVTEGETITEKVLITDIANQDSATEKSKYDILDDKNVQSMIEMSTESQTEYDMPVNKLTEDKQLVNEDLSTSVSYDSSTPQSKVTNGIDDQYEKTTEFSITSHKTDVQDAQEDERTSSEAPKQSSPGQLENEFTAQEEHQTTSLVPKEESQTKSPLEIIPTSDQSYISVSKSDSEIEGDEGTTESVPVKQDDLPIHTDMPLKETYTISDESNTAATKLETEEKIITTEAIPTKQEKLPTPSEIDMKDEEDESKMTKTPDIMEAESDKYPTSESFVTNKPLLISKSTEENIDDATKSPDVLEEQPYTSKVPEMPEEQSTSRTDSESVTKLNIPESFGTTQEQYGSESGQEETPKTPEYVEEHGTSQSDIESVTKQVEAESYTTEKQYVTKSDQEASEIPEVIDEQSTSRIDTEAINEPKVSVSSTTEKHFESETDQEEIHKIPEISEEQSTSRIDTEAITEPKVSVSSTTEKQFETETDQEEIHKIPEITEEQSTSRIDTEAITEQKVSESFTTEKSFETESDQGEIHKIPEITEEQSTSRIDTEAITEPKVSESSTTEKSFETESDQEKIHKIPELTEEQSTSRIDTEAITEPKVSESSTTEKPFETESDQGKIHTIPELTEEQSTSRIDTEAITEPKVSESSTTEKSFETEADQEKIHKIPELTEEQSTSRIDTEAITEQKVSESSTTEKSFETEADQEKIHKIPERTEEQSTSRIETETITEEKVSEPSTSEKESENKVDQEEIPTIPVISEEQSTAQTDTEIATNKDDSGFYTTEKQYYVTISEQEDIQKIPVFVDEQSSSQSDNESVTKFDDSDRATTERQYISETDHDVSEVIEEHTTSRTETVTKPQDTVSLTTVKQYVTQSILEEIPEIADEKEKHSTSQTDIEPVTKSEDSEIASITTEKTYEVKLDEGEVPKGPEIIDEHSTSRIDTEGVTNPEYIEAFTTQKQYVTKSDLEETPVVVGEHTTSRIETDSVPKLEDSAAYTTEKQEVTKTDIGEIPSDELETDAHKLDKDIEDSEKTTALPMLHADTTAKSELQGLDLHKPSEDVTEVSQIEELSTKIVPIDASVSTSVSEIIEDTTKSVTSDTVNEENKESYTTERNVEASTLSDEIATVREPENKTPGKSTSEKESTYSETTPYAVLLEEHTHSVLEETSSDIPIEEAPTTLKNEKQPERGDQIPDTYESNDEYGQSTEKQIEQEDKTTSYDKIASPDVQTGTSTNVEETSTIAEKVPSSADDQDEDKKYVSSIQDEKTTPIIKEEQHTTIPSVSDKEFTTLRDIIMSSSERPELTSISTKNEGLQDLSPSTTSKLSEESTTHLPISEDKYKEKPVSAAPSPSSSEMPETVDESHDDEHSPDFPTSGAGGYGSEPDYGEEDQSFGPGTCRYGGKVYVSAQQIPRDDPCDFCFCFRSDIICLQQSCPPPIHGCHEEPIQGFCCPRYECPVSMATTVNVTTTTTTTTTTLPPHFLPHAYKGAAQRRGCQIKGHSYKVGEVVRASSGPCLHCTCGGDGQMKCDPKACTPEPMLRQMIAAAVSAKRRR